MEPKARCFAAIGIPADARHTDGSKMAGFLRLIHEYVKVTVHRVNNI